MIAFVIKTPDGYFGHKRDTCSLSNAQVFSSKQAAEDDSVENEKVVEVEIKRKGQ